MLQESPASPASLASAIRAKIRELGFPRAGFCDAAPPAEAVHFDRWLEAGMHGEMTWMMRGRDKRLDPGLVLEGARSMIVVALPYAAPGSIPPRAPIGEYPEPRGAVSRYALGDDYHRVMGDRLAVLQAFIEAEATGHRALAYVDTGPVLERLWASRAGIGWVGKNSLILDKEIGSFFFLGVVLTTLRLPPDEPAVDQCGSCTLCIEACPTGAIVEPRLVDSRRCISYQTIELRGPLPVEHREAIGDRVFGCDDCQDACPWNRIGSRSSDRAVQDALPLRAGSFAPPLLELLAMTHEEYLRRFRGSAIKRATFHGLRRNAAAALGNMADDSVSLAALERVAGDAEEDPVLREQAASSALLVRPRVGR